MGRCDMKDELIHALKERSVRLKGGWAIPVRLQSSGRHHPGPRGGGGLAADVRSLGAVTALPISRKFNVAIS